MCTVVISIMSNMVTRIRVGQSHRNFLLTTPLPIDPDLLSTTLYHKQTKTNNTNKTNSTNKQYKQYKQTKQTIQTNKTNKQKKSLSPGLTYIPQSCRSIALGDILNACEVHVGLGLLEMSGLGGHALRAGNPPLPQVLLLSLQLLLHDLVDQLLEAIGRGCRSRQT